MGSLLAYDGRKKIYPFEGETYPHRALLVARDVKFEVSGVFDLSV